MWEWLIPVLIVVALVVVVGIYLWATYNSLVQLNVRVEEAWSDITVQLKRRADLIPNLIETVKGYAAHEKGALEAVISARSRAVDASNGGSVGQRAEAEGFLTQSLGRLFALSEAYPDLKANTNFLGLQEELASTENKIGFARQHYNDCVGRYQTARQEFPGVIIAGAFNFAAKEYFEVKDAETREAPKVKF